jgi:AraC-like DNA-binding protein/ligand-binding sensor protein
MSRTQRAAGFEAGPSALVIERRSTVVSRLQSSPLFRAYQEAFEATTGLPLVLREAGSFRTPMEGSKKVNRFCVLMTENNKTCAACLQLQERLEAEATQQPKTLECYAGLSESAVPIRVGDAVLGYLQTGQVFFKTPGKRQFNAITSGIDSGSTGAHWRALKSAYHQTRVMTLKQYDAILQLLVIFAGHLATVSNQILMSGVVAEPSAISLARAFITQHHGEALGLADVARAVRVSACYFCRIFRKATGLTFTEYLARERVEAVKRMLRDANIRVSEAAYAAGFQSLSQFNRVFLRIEGEAPRIYRERLHGMPKRVVRTLAIHAA